jgi:Ca2+-binding EF-hand superfamily protein
MDKLRKLFAANDKDSSGSLDIDEFYEMFHSTKTPFGDSLFNLVDLDGNGEFLTFSEFVQVVTTFCLFGPNEVLRFAFNVVDVDKSGFISLAELDMLAGWLHKGGPANLNTAIEKIKEKYDKGDGNLSFETFKKIYREFPFLLFPAFQLQDNMMHVVFGQKWWDKKRKQLDMVKVDEIPDGPSLLTTATTVFKGLFPATAASISDKLPSIFKNGFYGGGDDDGHHALGKFGDYGGGIKLPPAGPELIAHREFMAKVAEQEEEMEYERKMRMRQVREAKRVEEDRQLQLKRERMKKRRQRMLSAELLDPNAPALLLTHQPASVVKLFGK